MLVVDSSVAASWAIPDESSDAAAHALREVSMGRMLVPVIFWYEFRNVLIVNERRRRLLIEETVAGLGNVRDLTPETDPQLPDDTVMVLARKHSLTVYDAAYLELALRRGAALATLDTRLAAAATAEGMPSSPDQTCARRGRHVSTRRGYCRRGGIR